MSKFITELDARLKADTDDIWILDSPLEYISDVAGRIVVPAQFETDLASVPRIPIIYAMWGNKAHREAVLHDYLYRIDSNPCVEKSIADDVFFESMELRGKPGYIRYPMYWGVVLGGQSSFHQKKVDAIL